jgi:hypothetical protein
MFDRSRIVHQERPQKGEVDADYRLFKKILAPTFQRIALEGGQQPKKSQPALLWFGSGRTKTIPRCYLPKTAAFMDTWGNESRKRNAGLGSKFRFSFTKRGWDRGETKPIRWYSCYCSPQLDLGCEPFAKQIPMAKRSHDCGRVCRAWEQSHRIRTARPCLAQRIQQAIQALRRHGQVWRDSDADW